MMQSQGLGALMPQGAQQMAPQQQMPPMDPQRLAAATNLVSNDAERQVLDPRTLALIKYKDAVDAMQAADELMAASQPAPTPPTVAERVQQSAQEGIMGLASRLGAGIQQQGSNMQAQQMQQAMSGGLPQLPAPNMAGMAQGGIVGYQEGGDVEDSPRLRRLTQQLIEAGMEPEAARAEAERTLSRGIPLPPLPGLPRVPNLLPDPTAPARAAARVAGSAYDSLPDAFGGGRSEDFGRQASAPGAVPQGAPFQGSMSDEEIADFTQRRPPIQGRMSDEEIADFTQQMQARSSVRGDDGFLTAFPTLSRMAQGDQSVVDMTNAQRIGAIIRDLGKGPVDVARGIVSDADINLDVGEMGRDFYAGITGQPITRPEGIASLPTGPTEVAAPTVDEEIITAAPAVDEVAAQAAAQAAAPAGVSQDAVETLLEQEQQPRAGESAADRDARMRRLIAGLRGFGAQGLGGFAAGSSAEELRQEQALIADQERQRRAGVDTRGLDLEERNITLQDALRRQQADALQADREARIRLQEAQLDTRQREIVAQTVMEEAPGVQAQINAIELELSDPSFGKGIFGGTSTRDAKIEELRRLRAFMADKKDEVMSRLGFTSPGGRSGGGELAPGDEALVSEYLNR